MPKDNQLFNDLRLFFLAYDKVDEKEKATYEDHFDRILQVVEIGIKEKYQFKEENRKNKKWFERIEMFITFLPTIIAIGLLIYVLPSRNVAKATDSLEVPAKKRSDSTHRVVIVPNTPTIADSDSLRRFRRMAKELERLKDIIRQKDRVIAETDSVFYRLDRIYSGPSAFVTPGSYRQTDLMYKINRLREERGIDTLQ